MLSPSVFLSEDYEAQAPHGWPTYRNPLFCAIIARKLAYQMGEKKPSPDLLTYARKKVEEARKITPALPDLIVAGANCVFLPVSEKQFHSPFFLPERSRLALQQTDGLSLALGLLVLSWALDSIMLGQLEWPLLLAEALDIPLQKLNS